VFAPHLGENGLLVRDEQDLKTVRHSSVPRDDTITGSASRVANYGVRTMAESVVVCNRSEDTTKRRRVVRDSGERMFRTFADNPDDPYADGTSNAEVSLRSQLGLLPP
jgi:hypothetical protein